MPTLIFALRCNCSSSAANDPRAPLWGRFVSLTLLLVTQALLRQFETRSATKPCWRWLNNEITLPDLYPRTRVGKIHPRQRVGTAQQPRLDWRWQNPSAMSFRICPAPVPRNLGTNREQP